MCCLCYRRAASEKLILQPALDSSMLARNSVPARSRGAREPHYFARTLQRRATRVRRDASRARASPDSLSLHSRRPTRLKARSLRLSTPSKGVGERACTRAPQHGSRKLRSSRQLGDDEMSVWRALGERVMRRLSLGRRLPALRAAAFAAARPPARACPSKVW